MDANGYQFIFPDVMNWLDYSHKLSPADYLRVEIPDARDVLSWYFSEMTGGVAFERGVNESWNTDFPHILTRENFKNARNISSMGWSYETLPPILDRILPELEAIPPWADLFDSEDYDSAVGTLVDVLNGHQGFGIANATKILYQKRPCIMPILDQFNRMALNVPSMDEDVVTPALCAIRRIANHESNASTISNLHRWILSNPSVTAGLPLSTLRILDILAWGAIRQRKRSPDAKA